MKSFLPLLLFALTTMGCAQQTLMRTTVTPLDPNTSSSSLTLLRQQIADRLQREGFRMSTVEPSQEQDHLIIEAHLGNDPDEVKRFQWLFQSNQTEFWATYRVTDLALQPWIGTLPRIDSFIPFTQFKEGYHPPEVLGLCMEADQKQTILEELSQSGSMPSDCKLVWSKEPTDLSGYGYSFYELALIKTSGQQVAPVSNRNIKQAQVEIDPQSEEFMIGFTLDADGTQAFKDLTTQAMEEGNRSIAIMLNGEVLSMPSVRGAITGGKGIINGAFNYEEASKIAASLHYEPLVIPVAVEFKIVE